jgi:hypothetical protein
MPDLLVEMLDRMIQPLFSSIDILTFTMLLMILITLVELRIPTLKTLISHRHSKFLFQRRTSSVQKKEIR